MLELKALSTHFRIAKGRQLHAVDQVSLTLNQGEVLGLVGESGSGKSTLAKTVAGLQAKTSGDILWNNQSLPKKYSSRDFAFFAKQIQMIFQDPYGSLNPRMTVAEILREPLQLTGITNTQEQTQRISKWLKQVNLPLDAMSRYPHEFSGGQRQRIGIARALIVEPQLVICDEPISALDVSVQAQIINLLQTLKTEMGLTLLFIGHDLSMVRYISDRIAVMYMGVLVEEGDADALFFDPKHPYTKLLIAANPVADPKIEKQRKHEPISGEVGSPINPKNACRFVNRCPDAMDRCRNEIPKTIRQDQRLVACHLYD